MRTDFILFLQIGIIFRYHVRYAIYTYFSLNVLVSKYFVSLSKVSLRFNCSKNSYWQKHNVHTHNKQLFRYRVYLANLKWQT